MLRHTELVPWGAVFGVERVEPSGSGAATVQVYLLERRAFIAFIVRTI
jgi:hypothetical protein